MNLNKINEEQKEKIRRGFFKAIKKSYENIILMSPTSPKKVIPIHAWLAESFQMVLGDEYIVYANGFNNFKNNKEVKIKGKYFEKNVDVAIKFKKTDKFIGVVEVKFHFNNLSQNENNNIENLLGYTVNVRGNNMLFANLIIIREKTPYIGKEFKHNGVVVKNSLKTIEDHGPTKWGKYEKILASPPSNLHRPDSLAIIPIKLGIENELENMIGKQIHKKGTKECQMLLENIDPSFSDFVVYVDSEGIKTDIVNFIETFCLKVIVKSIDIF